MELSNLQTCRRFYSIAIISEEVVDTVQEMVRQLVRVIRVRRLVPEHPDRALKVDRCLCTDEFRREASQCPSHSKEIVSVNLGLLNGQYLKMELL